MSLLNIVLIEPEIPQNTGTIGRLCLALQSRLHLVKPLGFDISDQQLKRAGLDYWKYLDLKVHENIDSFFHDIPPDASMALFSKKAGHVYTDFQYKKGMYLIFGKETAGIPDWILNKYPTDTVRIPILDARVRSLNLANAVSIGAYEALRQVQPSC